MKIKVWERFAFWDDRKDSDYRWWPVVVSQYDRRMGMLMVELQWLRWRTGISLLVIKKQRNGLF